MNDIHQDIDTGNITGSEDQKNAQTDSTRPSINNGRKALAGGDEVSVEVSSTEKKNPSPGQRSVKGGTQGIRLSNSGTSSGRPSPGKTLPLSLLL